MNHNLRLVIPAKAGIQEIGLFRSLDAGSSPAWQKSWF